MGAPVGFHLSNGATSGSSWSAPRVSGVNGATGAGANTRRAAASTAGGANAGTAAEITGAGATVAALDAAS
jgi:hypothetical protein